MKSMLQLNKHTGCAFAAATFVLFASATATAADPAEEIAIAKQHAEFAVAAADLAAVHAHLHHVINCLMGPNGEGFDAKELNPCQDLGNGALTDLTVGDSRQAMSPDRTVTSAAINMTDIHRMWVSAAAYCEPVNSH